VIAQTSGTTQLLQAIHAVNDRVVWASGHGGVVLRTLDGGEHWERRLTPAGDSLEFRDVHALNADTAWILAAGSGAKSRIYRTNDGGGTWALQFLNADSAAFYDCLSFGTREQGVVFSDASNGRTNILRTDNGGRSWTLLAPSVVPAPLTGEGGFAASGLCVVHGDANTVYIATGAPGARLFRSRDAGRTWSVENTPFTRGTAAGLTGLSFTDALHGMAVGGDVNKLRTDTSSSVVGVTSDGGRTWEMRRRPILPGFLSGVAMVPAAGSETAVVVSYGGASYTDDGGRTWHALTDLLMASVSASGRRAWIGGGGGRLMRIEW
jgi:photosystem II stability/assembly factor-like uncharacterized protein